MMTPSEKATMKRAFKALGYREIRDAQREKATGRRPLASPGMLRLLQRRVNSRRCG